ncbi:MAG: hypothetical protein IT176_12060 [Acidobacteria bacterium]|nr:hypothetical protein [Acidobacteriota bacterium]
MIIDSASFDSFMSRQPQQTSERAEDVSNAPVQGGRHETDAARAAA